MTGSAISHYKVISELGRGGMGVVYKAEDTKLNRIVALKVLSPHMLGSADDRARFYREARAAAALHHPNIATVFEIDEFDDAPFIAMEFVDGESLDEYISQRPLPLKEVVEIASQVAEALKAAHRKNIVHRDVKSANIKLTSSGVAKVLDFGLAKTAASTKLTQMGSTVGTVAYMSPEQARGHEVDQRSDIWSLGAVIYEMISGKLPFPGEYEQAVVYNILNADPEPLTAIRTGVPIGLERIVAKCLSKDPDARYQSAVEIPVDLRAVDLEQSSTTSGLSAVLSTPLPPDAGTRPTESRSRARLGWAAAGAIAGIALTAGLFSVIPRASSGVETPPLRRLSIVLPDAAPLAPVGSAPIGVGRSALTLSRDGSRLAYITGQAGSTRIATRSMDEQEVNVLEGTEGAYLPFFSPDGDWIGFFVGNVVKRVAWSGGTPLLIAQIPGPALSAVWVDDQIIVSDAEANNYYVVAVEEGRVRRIPRPRQRVLLDALPDGKTLLISGAAGIAVAPAADLTDRKMLGIQGWSAQYVDSGHILFGLRGRMMSVPFDLKRLEITGTATPYIDNVRTEAVSVATQFASSPGGTVIYVPGRATDLGRLVRIDKNGNEQDLGFSPEVFGSMQLSPDGSKLVIVINDPGEDIYVYDLDRRTRSILVGTGRNQSPIWTHDGRAVVYSSRILGATDLDSVNVIPISGGSARTIYSSDLRTNPASLSSDGRVLATTAGNQIAFVDMQTGAVVDSLNLIDNPALKWGAQFSPDSRYVAYTSHETGQSDVFVRSTSRGGGKWQVSIDGGEEPIWSEAGDKLFYSNGRTWYAVPVAQGTPFSFGRPQVLFEGPYLNVPGVGYDAFPGDEEFIVVRELEQHQQVTILNVIEDEVRN